MKKRFLTVGKFLVCSAIAATMFSCSNKQTAPTSVSDSKNADGLSNVAYVYADSLVNGYDLYNDEATKLMEKQSKYEQDLQSKGKSLERRMMELEQNLKKNLITPTRYQELGQQLMAERDKLMQNQQQISMELQDDQIQIMNRVSDSIKSYINSFNADKRYKMIINCNAALLYADPELDITKQILDGLNDNYRKGKSTTDSTAK
jgi:outer membrane protein